MRGRVKPWKSVPKELTPEQREVRWQEYLRTQHG